MGRGSPVRSPCHLRGCHAPYSAGVDRVLGRARALERAAFRPDREGSQALCRRAQETAKDAAGELAARIARLIAELGDDNYATRQRAQEQLAQIGAEAFDALAEAQSHDDPEIAARSRYLLRGIRIEFTKEGDPAVVRQQLKEYHSLAPTQRLARIQALAVISDPAALAALCRIARYEQTEVLAKQAAVAVVGQKLPVGADLKQRAELIVGTLGVSQRPGSRWLRAYAEAGRGAAERIDGDWARFTAEEVALLRRSPDRSHADVVSGLLKYRVELLGRIDRQKDVEPVLKQLVEVQPEEGVTLTEFMAWVQEKKAWAALDFVQKRFGEKINGSPVLLYALASAREAQGQTKAADEAAAKALSLNADDLLAHCRTAVRPAGPGDAPLGREGAAATDRLAAARQQLRHVLAVRLVGVAARPGAGRRGSPLASGHGGRHAAEHQRRPREGGQQR